MQLSPEEEQLEENARLLAQVGDVDADVAKRVLQKHKGDIQRAADAILEGDRGETNAWETQHRTTPEPGHSRGRSTAVARHPSSSVIDLTRDAEEELSRAIEMSMQEDKTSVVRFKPTDRAPHPDWQMVRSNAPVAGASSTPQDKVLDDAIQASLKDFHKEDDDPFPSPMKLREGGRPIALRHTVPTFSYVTLVLHALYHIPQVRSILSTIRLPQIDAKTALDSTDRDMWSLIELFTNLDLAQISYIIDNEVVRSLGLAPLNPTDPLSHAATNAVKKINHLIERHLRAQAREEEPERLFSFTHGRVSIGPGKTFTKVNPNPEYGAVVVVDFGGQNPHNDLVSCMEHILMTTEGNITSYDVILSPPDVIGFQLTRSPIFSNGSSKPSPDPIVYPKTIYLDRFLFDNLMLVIEKRKTESKMRQEIKELTNQREVLTRCNGWDTLSDLRSTLYYYENIAEKGDETRQRSIEKTITQLKGILTRITAEVENINHRLEKLQSEVTAVFNCPELQQYQYDLRAVLMHTGLPGRKQMYSYIQDVEGTWWKTVDTEVTEVPEETVLNDPTGLHLSAGPYLLFYSRHLTEEQLREPLVWPIVFSEAVEDCNKRFVATMHPELGILLDDSPSAMHEAPTADQGNPGAGGPERESSWAMTVD